MKSDAEDLRSFATSGDEAAFRRIVERHAPMVHGVSWRRTQNRSLAEDVTQNVFVILARKARHIPHQELAGWLYRTAFMESLNASRKEAKRQQALNQLTAMSLQHDPQWEEVSPHLDEVISQLSPVDRQLVVMRYFEQLNYREICEATGRTEEASRKQMQRALERLGSLLKRRGVITSGTALGAVLTTQTLCIPPASAALIATTALHSVPAAAAFSSISALYLMTTQTALKITAIVLVIAAIPTAVILGGKYDGSRPATPPATAIASTLPGSKGSAAAPATPGLPGRESIRKTQIRPDRSTTDNEPPEHAGFQIISTIDWSETIKKSSSRLAGRLTSRLDLSADQQAKLTAYFAEKDRKTKDAIQQNMKNGEIDIASSTGNIPFSPSIVTAVSGGGNDQDLDSFLTGILTPEQQAVNNTFREQERQDTARKDAEEHIEELSKYVDLTPAQKEQLFTQADQRSLAPQDPAEPAVDATAEAKQLLTPEQLAVYEKGKAEDEPNEGMNIGDFMITRKAKDDSH